MLSTQDLAHPPCTSGFPLQHPDDDSDSQDSFDNFPGQELSTTVLSTQGKNSAGGLPIVASAPAAAGGAQSTAHGAKSRTPSHLIWSGYVAGVPGVSPPSSGRGGMSVFVSLPPHASGAQDPGLWATASSQHLMVTSSQGNTMGMVQSTTSSVSGAGVVAAASAQQLQLQQGTPPPSPGSVHRGSRSNKPPSTDLNHELWQVCCDVSCGAALWSQGSMVHV